VESIRIPSAPSAFQGRRAFALAAKWSFVGCVAAIVALGGCGGSSGSSSTGARTADDSRVVAHAGIDFGRDVSTAERLGFGPSGPAAGDPHAGAANANRPASAKSDSVSPFAWTTPKGWTELAPSAMRTANFHPAGDPHAECYLTLLNGDAGGLGANVNRWRAQLGLAALAQAEIDALPKGSLFGRDAVLLEASGTWKGMGGSEAAPGYALAGLLLVDPNGSAFLKMTGPATLVTEQRAAFLSLAKSFRESTAAAHDAPRSDEIPANTKSSGSADGPAASDEFAYAIPEGWRKAPDRPMRKVSFFAGSGEALECYVTVFPGEAGGILANVNRWRGQLEASPIAESDLVGLPKIPMLGREAVLVECSGKGQQLVGAACQGNDRSVFVKMSGPPSLVQEQRAAFLAFCASLQSRK
jgi:hypothetical protein